MWKTSWKSTKAKNMSNSYMYKFSARMHGMLQVFLGHIHISDLHHTVTQEQYLQAGYPQNSITQSVNKNSFSDVQLLQRWQNKHLEWRKAAMPCYQKTFTKKKEEKDFAMHNLLLILRQRIIMHASFSPRNHEKVTFLN